MSRRLALLLLVVLAVPALALAAPGDPKEQFTAADQRKAASIVLKPGDFAAGWKKLRSTPEDDQRLTCAGVYNPDESDLILTGRATSEFQHAGSIPSVQSFSSVYKTRAHAVASWTRSVKPGLARCAAQIFKKQLESPGVKVALLRQGAVVFPKVAPRTVAYRIAFRITVTQAGQTTAAQLTIHLIALGNGRGDAGLITVASGNGVPLADLGAFAKVTASRLAAAKL